MQDPQYQTTVTPVANGLSGQLTMTVDRQLRVQATQSGVAPVGGGITWGAPTPVTLTGSSQTLAAANASRKAVQIINRIGNAAVAYDLAGGVVTLIGGVQMAPSVGQRDWYTGADCPVGAITIIGTATQIVTVIEGT